MMETKVCGKCKLEKDHSQFTKNKSNKDGLDALCRECKAIKQAEYRKNRKQREAGKATVPAPAPKPRPDVRRDASRPASLAVPLADYPDLAERLAYDAKANFRANDLPGHVLFILDWYLNLEDEDE